MFSCIVYDGWIFFFIVFGPTETSLLIGYRVKPMLLFFISLFKLFAPILQLFPPPPRTLTTVTWSRVKLYNYISFLPGHWHTSTLSRKQIQNTSIILSIIHFSFYVLAWFLFLWKQRSPILPNTLSQASHLKFWFILFSWL